MSDAALNSLTLEKLNYTLGHTPLFQDLNAHFSPSLIGLAGTNGSGKSTLLSILSGTLAPDAGRVLINGRSLYKDSTLKGQIGFVPATPFLYPYLTVFENLLTNAKIRGIKGQQQQKITKVLHDCQLLDYQKILFQSLSDGLKKRVMLAAMLVVDPSILLIDEPCTGLCPEQRAQLWSLLASLRSTNRIILFPTHHPEEAVSFCDTMLTLCKGELKPYHAHNQFSQTVLTQSQEAEPERIITEKQG